MPTRILRDGILTSERVAKLGWGDEVFYRRLMSVADDHGRFYALPALLRAACYPLHLDKVSDADIGKWLTACVNAALVSVYPASDGKRYLQIHDFGQRVQSKSKFPDPSESRAEVPLRLMANGNAQQSTVDHGEPPLVTVDNRLVGVGVGVVKELSPSLRSGDSSRAENGAEAGDDNSDDEVPEGRRKRATLACPVARIADLWDECIPEKPSVTLWTEPRRAAIGARWRQMAAHYGWKDQAEGLDWFGRLFRKIRESEFLMGQVRPRNKDDKPFALDMDWAFGPKNFTKIVEGKYHEQR